ncbi:hypothetical protein [Candidatus Lokiarchaeum ossiferum]|uniref:Loki-CTERM sorting domain-containing protein n=1 Tax=Candidatus Lokiarchaeum ossiferum TaxID=2951803 RepID=UPI00352F901B
MKKIKIIFNKMFIFALIFLFPPIQGPLTVSTMDIAFDPKGAVSEEPAVEGDSKNLVWDETHLNLSGNYGSTSTNVGHFDPTYVLDPEIALGKDGNVHLLWSTLYPQNGELESVQQLTYKNFDRKTGEWGDTLYLPLEYNYGGYEPSILLDDDDYAHISWSEGKEENDGWVSNIIYMGFDAEADGYQSTDFGRKIKISEGSTVRSIQHQKFYYDEHLHFVWLDNYDFENETNKAQAQIYYRNLSLNSLSLGDPVRIGIEDEEEYRDISCDMDSKGVLHISWIKGTDWNIYYRSYDTKSGDLGDMTIIGSDSNLGTVRTVVDNNDNVYIEYANSTSQWFHFANITGIEQTGIMVSNIKLYSMTNSYFIGVPTVDSFGNLNIPYVMNSSTLGFDILTLVGGNLNRSVIIHYNESMTYRSPELKIDDYGFPHLLYFDQGYLTDANAFRCIYSTTTVPMFAENEPTFTVYYDENSEVVSENSSSLSESPEVIIDENDNAHVVWVDSEELSDSDIDPDIFYRFRSNETGEWDDPVLVSEGSTASSSGISGVLDYNGNLHYVWSDTHPYLDSGADTDIFYRNLTVSNGEWSDIELVSTNCSSFSDFPDITVDNRSIVHIVWSDMSNMSDSGDDLDVFYRSLNFSSGEWKDIMVISSFSNGTSMYPSIGAASWGVAMVVWQDDSDAEYQENMTAGSDPDIFQRRIIGTTMLYPDLISINSTHESTMPELAIAGNDMAHVVYREFNGSSFEIMHANMIINKWDWSNRSVFLVSESENLDGMAISIDSKNELHVVFNGILDNNGMASESEIYYMKYDNSAEIWSTITNVAPEFTGSSYSPSLGVSHDGYVYFVWIDGSEIYGSGSDVDVFYKGIDQGYRPKPVHLYSESRTIDVLTLKICHTTQIGAEKYNTYVNDVFIGNSAIPRSNLTFPAEGSYLITIKAVIGNLESDPSNVLEIIVDLPEDSADEGGDGDDDTDTGDEGDGDNDSNEKRKIPGYSIEILMIVSLVSLIMTKKKYRN